MDEKQFRCRAEVDSDFVPEEKREEIAPKTFKDKLKNFWYYYKWHTVIIVFIAAVLGYGFVQCCMKERPDYTVMTAFDKYVPSEVTDELEEYLEKYGEDINGDGKVIVHVYDASTGTDTDTQQAHSTRLMAEMQQGEVMLFFVDDTYFNRLNKLEVFEKNDLFPDKDGYALDLRHTDLTDKLNDVKDGFIRHDYYVAKRVVKGTDFEKVEKSVKSEKKNLKLLEKFIDGLEFRE